MIATLLAFILFCTTVVFGVLFGLYYYKLDQYKKDKEEAFKKRELEIAEREKALEKTQSCVQQFKTCLI